MTQVSDRLVSTPTARPSPLVRSAQAPKTDLEPCPLSVVVPTRNESGNVEPLLRRLEDALDGLPAEVVFVDDSDDATPDVVAALMQRRAPDDRLQVSLLHRAHGARNAGLSGAVVAGLGVTQGTWVCVMDGDLQHPPETILDMLAAAESEQANFVVATRYSDGGHATGLDGVARRLVSRAASDAAKILFRRSLGSVSDPMSGFFLFRRDMVDPDGLRPLGFKILMELAVRTPGLRIAEVPYTFEERHAGTSKASVREAVAYARHLVRLRVDTSRLALARTGRRAAA